MFASALIVTIAQAQEKPAPDKKDYLLQAIEVQRNEALLRTALCQAESAISIDALNGTIAKLKQQLVEANEQLGKLRAGPTP